MKKRMISGIKPTGAVTLGNYLGAIKPFVSYQDEYDLNLFIADLHALTIYQEPKELRENTDNLIAIYLAAGLDPSKVKIFKQSDVPAHNQLEWVLTCSTQLPELTKMPQYKNFVERHPGESVPAGMLLYPSLMNADILLYDADYVPVGIDQKPHVDLTRDIAERFNKIYGATFTMPQAVLAKTGAKIMSLSDPTKKMSKSESDKGTIYLLEDVGIARKKIMKALTDCDDKVYYDPIKKPGVSNLLNIYCAITGCAIEAAEAEFKNVENYGAFKRAVADVVCNEMLKIQESVNRLKNEENHKLIETLRAGKEYATGLANSKIEEVYQKIGLR